MTHENNEDMASRGWEKMANSGEKRAEIAEHYPSLDRFDAEKPISRVIEALDTCFRSVDILIDSTRTLEDRLEFILAPSMERGNNKPVDEESALSAMIARINDLDRKIWFVNHNIVDILNRTTL